MKTPLFLVVIALLTGQAFAAELQFVHRHGEPIEDRKAAFGDIKSTTTTTTESNRPKYQPRSEGGSGEKPKQVRSPEEVRKAFTS